MIKQVDEKLLSAVCVLNFLRFNARITGTEVYVSWNQPFPLFFFFNECVGRNLFRSDQNRNQIKLFKLDKARSGYPVSRARGSCIIRSSILGRIGISLTVTFNQLRIRLKCLKTVGSVGPRSFYSFLFFYVTWLTM